MDQGRLTKLAKSSTKVLKTTNKNLKSTILISINPQHVHNIFNKTKRFEYRKRIAKNVEKLVIYETTPIKKVVGEAEVVETICLSPKKLWNKTKKMSGINKLFFESYFRGKSLAYAYKLGTIKIYSKPKTLKHFNLKVAPQSYAYVWQN